MVGSEIVQITTEKINQICENMKVGQVRKKMYVNKRRKLIGFQMGDDVMIKVSPLIGMVRFRKKGKLGPICGTVC